MQLTEVLDASTTARICADGCLVADVRAARTGIQEYLGREVDPDNAHGLRDQAVVRVYRPEDEVFNRDSMASFAAAPFTIDHPAEPVNAGNWRKLGVGEVNGDVVRDGGFVRVPIIVRDAAAVAKVNTTHKQLSMGYSCQLDFTPGELADGAAYDAVQRNIRINHIAAVPAARGGPQLKISDERTSQHQEKQMKKIVLDGLQVDLSDADAVNAAISKLQDKATVAEKALADATAAHDKAIAKKDAEIDDLKSKVVDQAKIDALADAKAAVVAKAKSLIGDKLPDTAGKSPAELRRIACAMKLGDAAVADKSDDYIEARFDALATDVKPIFHRPALIGDTAAIRDAARAARHIN